MKVADLKQKNATLPIAVRKQARKEHLELLLNPRSDFDPETFQPNLESDDPDYEVRKRVRKTPPKRLPTMGMKPFEFFEGQMIGMYESKQELYLLIAWLSERVSDLEDEIKLLKK